jgi:hypothetical protein
MENGEWRLANREWLWNDWNLLGSLLAIRSSPPQPVASSRTVMPEPRDARGIDW